MSQKALHGTACKGCRRRGRKCDRTLPTCLSCERRGVVCEGYVTRWPGVAARGKLAGRSIPVSSSPITTSKRSSARARRTLSSGAAPANHDSVQHDEKRIPKTDGIHSTSWSVDGATHTEDNDITKLVHHYVDDLSNIFYLGDGSGDNPMFRYVLPLINSVPPIRFAIAASASCHMAARNSDEELERKSLYLRVRATHFLRERLNDSSIATDQATLASILMLAQVDMCSGDCIEFETHLQAAVAILRGRHVEQSVNRYYFEQRLVWLDIISSTSSSRAPNFTTTEISTALHRHSSADGREWSYDVFPCPIDLFEMLVDVTMLYKSHPNRDHPKESERKRVNDLMDRLRKWKSGQMLSGSRKHMVEAWRFGIMAYLAQLFPTCYNIVQMSNLTSQVLHHAKIIPSASSWSYSLLWPIFQVGVALETRQLQEKDWIRSRLKLAYEAVGCRHFRNAADTLELAWEKRIQGGFVANGTYERTIMLA